MHILLIDDNAEQIDLLTKLLNSREHKSVRAVQSGKLALEALESEKFDVVICDYHMPEMTGHQVFTLLREGGNNCRFLLWTNANSNEIPEFEGVGYLGAIKKTEIDKLFGKLEAIGAN